MSRTEPSGRLARWRLRISEFDDNIRYVKEAQNSLANGKSQILTDGATTVEINEDIPCLIGEGENPDEALGDDEPVPVETREIVRIFQLKLSEDIMPSASTYDKRFSRATLRLFMSKGPPRS